MLSLQVSEEPKRRRRTRRPEKLATPSRRKSQLPQVTG